MDPALVEKRKKGIWCSEEIDLLLKLLIDNYDTYFFNFSNDPEHGLKVIQDKLHEDWAAQVTKLGFSERTAFQVADKLKRCLTITKKYISNNGEGAAGQRYHFPSYLRPLERKVREEYLKHRVDATFDEAEYLDPDFEISPSARAEDLLEQAVSVSSGAALPHTYAPVASVLPFTAGIPASHTMSCKRPVEEDNDYFFKKRRLLDAKRKLKGRKRYLKEIKIKYWEQKMKNELNCLNMSFQS